MSDGERTVVDAAGEYRYLARGGERVDGEWRSCRVVLTSERLVLATDGDRQAVPHGRIELPEETGTDAAGTALRIGDAVVVIDADTPEFRAAYCRAALDGAVALLKHPAVVGGVVQEASWSKCRLRVDEKRLRAGRPDAGAVTVAFDTVDTVETGRATVAGEQRPLVKIGHTEDGQSVETHVSGAQRHTRALATLLESSIEGGEYELSETESQVLMALYSGVSPFEMGDFVGIDVDRVEEIYDRLLEVGAVDKVRERTEVALNAQGRNMASEAMSEE